MKKILIVLLCLASLPVNAFRLQENYVVCVHGFMGNPWTMSFMEKQLRKDGWKVINWGYPSRDRYIREHGQSLANYLEILALANPGKPIHFVTHSMGGLVLQSAFNHPVCPDEAKVGRVVMIAPPIHGSAWARWLSQFTLVEVVGKGYAGKELMKENFDDLGEFPETLEKVLVIAGNLSFNPILDGENDGTLLVEETRLPIPHEHVVIWRGHKSLVISQETFDLTRDFLKTKVLP